MMPHPLRFRFAEEKGVEALTYVASCWPGITAFHASTAIFLAEKKHLNRYGRPIIADTFKAMGCGPVPTTIYAFINGDLRLARHPGTIREAVFLRSDPHPSVTALRGADVDALSPSDVECLDGAIAFCRGRGFQELSDITRRDRCWIEAGPNGPIDYAAMIDEDNPRRDDILDEAMEFAAYGVL